MINNSSVISDKAVIGKNVQIGPYTIIHGNVVIGDNVVIEGFCEIGIMNSLCDDTPLIIGANSYIRSHSIFYSSSKIGINLITGHRVTIREKSNIGNNVQLGTLCDIQGHCDIGDYVKMHSNVHIGQKSKINKFVWIFPYVVLTNDPHPPSNLLLGCEIGEFAVIATMSVVLPGVKIGADVLIGAHSLVNRDVPEQMIYAGNPAKEVAHISKIILKDGSNMPAYPWRRHFHRGYPEELVSSWIMEFQKND